MNLKLSSESVQVILAFVCYLIGVALMGVVSHRFLKGGSFVKEYFVGNRGLGPWVLALSVAATAISGGTFMGFPSLIYTNGWVMALWIAGYMLVPLTTLALLGKRINQVARIAGSVTVPDVLRDRFQSPALGVLSTLLILGFLAVNLVAQFKAGGTVLEKAIELPDDVEVVGLSQGYVVGLAIFALTVVAYTTYGGFWAVTWTDVLEGLVMLAGVLVMAVLSLNAVPDVETRTPTGEKQILTGLAAATETLRRQDPGLVSAPGPANFLPLGIAFSFFLMWPLTSAGQPSAMVRLMSFRDSASVRRALLLICVYYLLTYLSLILIFICARAIFPTEYLYDRGNEASGKPDQIMPTMIRHLTRPLPAGSMLAGFMMAAPFAAIMSTVAAFLLMISSSLVRDLYQRCWNPDASPRRLKMMSYTVTALVGIGVMLAALNPPRFLQYIIVFTGTGLGCSFLVPMALALYWKRATRAGVLASMLGGFGAVFSLYVLGWIDSACQDGRMVNARDALNAMFGWLPGWGEARPDPFNPVFLCGFDTVIWGLTMSLLLGVGVSLLTKPNEQLVRKYFPDVHGV